MSTSARATLDRRLVGLKRALESGAWTLSAARARTLLAESASARSASHLIAAIHLEGVALGNGGQRTAALLALGAARPLLTRSQVAEVDKLLLQVRTLPVEAEPAAQRAVAGFFSRLERAELTDWAIPERNGPLQAHFQSGAAIASLEEVPSARTSLLFLATRAPERSLQSRLPDLALIVDQHPGWKRARLEWITALVAAARLDEGRAAFPPLERTDTAKGRLPACHRIGGPDPAPGEVRRLKAALGLAQPVAR